MTSDMTSILKCNAGWLALEESVAWGECTDFETGPRLQSIDRSRRFMASDRAAKVDYFQLEDVVFDGQTGAVFKQGSHIAETRYSTPDAYVFSYNAERTIASRDVRTAFIGFHAWHNNYYHWITQCVPAIYWACRTGSPYGLVFPLPPLTAWQEKALSLAGLEDIETVAIDDRHQYEVRRLAYTTFTQGATTYRPSRASVAVFDAMRDRAHEGAHEGAHGVADASGGAVYVSRRDTTNRRMTNEGELCGMLEAEGVRILIPGTYPIEEQVRLFAGAGLVIGPHGAGLTNIAFCAPGATLYEIMSDHSPNPCFANLAQSRGMHYYAEAFSHQTESPDGHVWEADADEVRATVRRLLGRSNGGRVV